MRTTLAIDDQLLDAAKKRATARGTSLGQYVEDALRRQLAEPAEGHAAPALPVFTRGTGMRQGIDPSSHRSLFDELDADGDLS
ncbi:MAG: hypothetical protein ABI310_09400 [Microbacteriaceae bacterium]